MSAINDGGPAFGGKQRVRRAGYDTNEFEPVNGMSLRDYFAAKAMQADYAASQANKECVLYRDVAERAYILADAMLKARSA